MPWAKGQSGNPSGARRKLGRNALIVSLKEHGEDMPMLRKIWQRAIKDAVDGDKDARKEILDRLDGKPATIIVGDDDEDAVRVVQTVEWMVVSKDEG